MINLGCSISLGTVPSVFITSEIPVITSYVITAIHTSLHFTDIWNYCKKRLLFLFWFGIPFALLNVNDAEAGVCLVYTNVFAV
jgi:hypothetical protein